MLRDILSDIPFVRRYYSGIATILMLHRVDRKDPKRLHPNENMKVSPERLERIIIDARSNGYEFITLDRLYEILANQERVVKKLVITLDDGYADNCEVAYPIFKKHNVPFVIYLTTAFPERKAILWWYGLEDLIVQNDKIELSDGSEYYCRTIDEKVRTFFELRDIIIPLNKDNLLESIHKLFENYDIDWHSLCDTYCMSWDQVGFLSKDELCTIGGHTKNHYAMNKLSHEEIIDEVSGANELIEEKTGRKVTHFAYPFGSEVEVGKNEFDIVKKLGFKTTTTTRRGNIYLDHKERMECLPRMMLHDEFMFRDIGRIRRKRIVTE